MIYGLSGASRTGKTTVAKAVAERLKMHYFDASVTRIMREHGVNGVANIGLDERIGLQEFILDKFIENVKAAPRPAISDRTPLDMIGYMLGEVTMHNTPPEHHARIQAYVDRCIAMTTLHFDMVIVLRPLPNYKVEEGKPPENRAYQSLVQFIIEGAVQNAEDVHSGLICSTNLKDRIDYFCEAIEERNAHMVEVMSHYTSH